MCEHHNKYELTDESDRYMGTAFQRPLPYYFCLDCDLVLRPIYGLGSRMPAGYMIENYQEYIREKYKKQIDDIIEEHEYTTRW